RGHGGGRERVRDYEGEQRLRQEARLEDATAVLVRDPALAAVADRFDDGHAHVPGLLLDRVDHGLDPLPQHDRLDLDHAGRPLRVWARACELGAKSAQRCAPAAATLCLSSPGWVGAWDGTADDRRSSKRVSRHTPRRVAIRSRTPTTRKPQRRWRARLARFSGKIEVWIVQTPAASAAATSSSSSARPTPQPRDPAATYTLSSATPA